MARIRRAVRGGAGADGDSEAAGAAALRGRPAVSAGRPGGELDPTHFSALQPLPVRIQFTAAALDSASQAAGLPLLPTALLLLIGEYDPATLPYYPAEETQAQRSEGYDFFEVSLKEELLHASGTVRVQGRDDEEDDED